MMNEAQVQPDPILERRSKRRFSGAERKRLLDEFAALGHGEKGPWLRRNGLFAAQLSQWRKLAQEGVAALEPKAAGRKPLTDIEQENAQLKKQLAKTPRVNLSPNNWLDFISITVRVSGA